MRAIILKYFILILWGGGLLLTSLGIFLNIFIENSVNLAFTFTMVGLSMIIFPFLMAISSVFGITKLFEDIGKKVINFILGEIKI